MYSIILIKIIFLFEKHQREFDYRLLYLWLRTDNISQNMKLSVIVTNGVFRHVDHFKQKAW